MIRTGSALLLIPVNLALLAWRLSIGASRVAPIRARLFNTGLITAVVSTICVSISWYSPFPLQADAGGGYSNTWNEISLYAAGAGSLVTLVLALFGIGIGRAILFIAAMALAVLTYAALLSNFV